MSDTGTRAKEYLVYAPVGLAYFLRDTTPTFMQMFVARGRSVVTQYENSLDVELTQAKSLGQLTVMFGKPELEKRIAECRAVGEAILGEAFTNIWPSAPTASDAPSTAPTPAPASAPTAPVTRDAAAASQLGIDAYDALSASQVIERLTDLSAAERDAVFEYELAHRNRKTILGRIEQLRRPV